MEQKEVVDRLENAFAATFIRELLPGIIHNFANPLNGIMGRVQLMEKRFTEMIAQLETDHPEVLEGIAPLIDKLRRDLTSIIGETDRFFDMFRDVSDMMGAVQCPTTESIRLSALVNLVLRFFDHYLEFKHGIVRDVMVEDLPEIQAVPRFFSLGLWSLFRYAHQKMGGGQGGRLEVRGDRKQNFVQIMLSYSLTPDGKWEEPLFRDARSLFESIGVQVEREAHQDTELLSLVFPHQDPTCCDRAQEVTLARR